MGSVGTARKVSPDWLQETMTCHSSNCFNIVWGEGNAPLVTSLPSSCYILICQRTQVSLCFSFTGGALLDLMQRCDEPPPSPGKRVLCRHPFDEAKRAYVCPSKVEALYHVYWKEGKVLN